MESSECDFWGISSSEKRPVHHIQSYFLVFRKSIASGDFLQDYFKAFVHPARWTMQMYVMFLKMDCADIYWKMVSALTLIKRDIACDCYFNPYGSLALDGLPILKKDI